MRAEVPSRAVYYLLPPSLYTAAQLERAVRAQSARRFGLLDVLAVLQKGIKAILPSEADAELRAEQLAIVDDYRTRILAEAKEKRTDTLLDLSHGVHELMRLVRPHFPALAEVEAEKDYYWTIFGIEACRLLLQAREVSDGDDVKVVAYERGPGGLPDHAIAEIPENDRYFLGLRVDAMISPSEDEAKNSDSPSPGPCTPETSTSAATAKTPPPTAPSKATPGPSAKSASTD